MKQSLKVLSAFWSSFPTGYDARGMLVNQNIFDNEVKWLHFFSPSKQRYSYLYAC